MEFSDVKLILGLGNPGAAYSDTRHNVGFMALTHFAVSIGLWTGNPKTFKSSFIVTGTLKGQKLVLGWPSTYMNLSGHAARELISFYKIAPDNFLVVHDEMDLPCGKVKASKGKGSAGHNGIDSIKEFVNFDYARLRIGIGRPLKDDWDQAANVKDYVLSPFTEEEFPLIEDALSLSSSLISLWALKGLEAAQRQGNRKEKKEKKEKAPEEGLASEKAAPEEGLASEKAPEEGLASEKAPEEGSS
ncbi:MAG: aminoacyl-tRNA hydrolase [Deltaproteobacteria bacterium]|jgi:PTH1 family peptidyl-tRNA hydrolase|nr:aminoacyl-tRNA hydrolase [Deltaproteobacteria bacterium]